METVIHCENSIGAKEGDDVVIEVYDSSKDLPLITYLVPILIFLLSFATLFFKLKEEYLIQILISSLLLSFLSKVIADRFFIKKETMIPKSEAYRRNKIIRVLDNAK